MRTSQTLLVQRAWSVYLPILTGKHRAWKEGWQQNPMGFLSQPRKRQVNRQRPSQDGRTRGLGIAGSPSRERDSTQGHRHAHTCPVTKHTLHAELVSDKMQPTQRLHHRDTGGKSGRGGWHGTSNGGYHSLYKHTATGT